MALRRTGNMVPLSQFDMPMGQERIEEARKWYQDSRQRMAQRIGAEEKVHVSKHWDQYQHWEKAVRLADQNGLSIREYMTALFCPYGEGFESRPYVPQPNMIANDKAIRRVRSYKDQGVKAFKARWNSWMNSFEAEVEWLRDVHKQASRQEILGIVLADPGMPFSPLFRYLLARKYKLRKLEKLYEVNAFDEYDMQPFMIRQLKASRYIPEDWRSDT